MFECSNWVSMNLKFKIKLNTEVLSLWTDSLSHKINLICVIVGNVEASTKYTVKPVFKEIDILGKLMQILSSLENYHWAHAWYHQQYYCA